MLLCIALISHAGEWIFPAPQTANITWYGVNWSDNPIFQPMGWSTNGDMLLSFDLSGTTTNGTSCDWVARDKTNGLIVTRSVVFTATEWAVILAAHTNNTVDALYELVRVYISRTFN